MDKRGCFNKTWGTFNQDLGLNHKVISLKIINKEMNMAMISIGVMLGGMFKKYIKLTGRWF